MKDINKRIIESVIFTMLLALGCLIFYFAEVAGYFRFSCPLRSLFHIDCPGCGGTRMVQSILELNFYNAFRCHNFVFITIPYLFYLYSRSFVDYIKHGAIQRKTLKIIFIYAVLFIIYTVFRNLPGFEFLKPIILKR